jgi:hypothetical protein
VLRSAPILRAGDLAAAGIPSEKVASLRAAVAGTS